MLARHCIIPLAAMNRRTPSGGRGSIKISPFAVAWTATHCWELGLRGVSRQPSRGWVLIPLVVVVRGLASHLVLSSTRSGARGCHLSSLCTGRYT